MRIISQIKEDFPYDKIVVYVNDNMILCRPIPDYEEKSYILGEYVDNERAMEVFDVIHIANKSYKRGMADPSFKMPEE